MNIFSKITYKTLKKNPVRTLVTIIGIVISTAMFVAVTTLAYSFYIYEYETVKYENGEYLVSGNAIAANDVDALVNENCVDSFAISKMIGYAEIGSTNNYKPFLCIIDVNKEFFDTMPVHLTAGRIPECENEILIPDHLYDNGNVKLKLNDTITLDIGNRYEIVDGVVDTSYELYQYTSFQRDDDNIYETLITDTRREFKIVGFYERPDFEDWTAPGYTAITYQNKLCFDKNNKTSYDVEKGASDRDKYDIYLFLKKNYKKSYLEITGKYNNLISNYRMMAIIGIYRYSNISNLLTKVASVFVMIIVIGSVAMIYGAFSISVSERTKQFGLLSSIGATKKQIRSMVLTEAMMISFIAIPVGIICGLVGITITLMFVSDKFQYILSSPYDVTTKINIWVIIISVIISLITVLISILIPAKRAAVGSTIEIIRQSNEVKVRRKNKPYKLTYKLFGVPGMLSRKYFSRSRKKYRITIFSIIISIILFIVTSTFCDLLRKTADVTAVSYNYDLIFWGYNGDNPEEFLQDVKKIDGVKNAMFYNQFFDDIVTKDGINNKLTDEFEKFADEYVKVYYDNIDENFNILDIVSLGIMFIDDGEYDKYLIDCGIKDEVFSDHYNAPGILFDKNTTVIYSFDEKEQANKRVTYEYSVFDGKVENLPTKTMDYPIGRMVKELPDIMKSDSTKTMTIIFPYSSKYLENYIVNENNMTDYAAPSFVFAHESGKHEKMVDGIYEYVKENDCYYGKDKFYDVYERTKEDKDLLTVINVFAYGFLVLMSLICVANVFNTISTNIALRRRDFAMLRSVGLSNRGIRVMMIYECILYGFRAIIFGVPISLLLAVGLNEFFSEGARYAYIMPYKHILISIVGVYFIVGISMLYAASKIKNDNLIDELKEENV